MSCYPIVISWEAWSQVAVEVKESFSTDRLKPERISAKFPMQPYAPITAVQWEQSSEPEIRRSGSLTLACTLCACGL